MESGVEVREVRAGVRVGVQVASRLVASTGSRVRDSGFW